MPIRQESLYKVRLGPKNEIMISVVAHHTAPDLPLLSYDGGNHALLRRNDEDALLLDYLHPDIRPQVKASRSVVIVELDPAPGATEPKWQYSVPVAIVASLPADVTISIISG